MAEGDRCIYFKIIGGDYTFLSLYVDDILIASYNKEMPIQVKSWLSSIFDMKNMGNASYVLGVEILEIRGREFLDYLNNLI